MKIQHPKTLDTIRREFSHRRERRIPERLRQLALSALRDEHSIDEVAQAAGISSQSIRNWKRAIDVVSTASSARPTPVELKVIDAPVQSPACGNESATPARIMLRSGAIVEVAVQLLDVRWLMALNGSVS